MRQPDLLRQTEQQPPEPYLTVNNLFVRFPTEDGIVNAVEGVSLLVTRGQTLAIVGESGSGTSVPALAVMGQPPLSDGHRRGVARRRGDRRAG